ncbi:MAG: type-F conjugative transfer system pilin assembly protein TraF [Caedimonadaceae bacterium]|nr:MAG: type-F conjugative transfer system pilin assembly protein TraF [Caedimonadaceae bacterium]
MKPHTNSLPSNEGVRLRTQGAHVFKYAPRPSPRLPAHCLKAKWYQYSVLRIEFSGKASFSLIIFLCLMVTTSCLKAEPMNSRTLNLKVLSKNWVKAQPCFFERRAEGWHWYQDCLRQDKVEKRQEEEKKPSLTPTEAIEGQRKALEQKLHAAIVEPNRENIIAYILLQKALMDQSQRFSETWKRVVMTTPSLDETLTHPVDQNARHVYYAEKSKDLSNRIKKLAQDYGLFFFFRQNCPYCHGFAPIVKGFSQKHGWSVLAISLDGGTLPEFPEAKRDNGIATHLQISHVPALIALNSKTGQLIPLAYGMVSESEIEERVDLLTRSFSSGATPNKATHDGLKK